MLITTGILLQLAGLLDPQELIAMARGYADHWWLAVLLVVLQIILFTFALAGSSILWVAATLYPPVTASIILTTGATLGGVSAYLFSRTLTSDWIHKVENSHIYRLLQKEDNFFTLLALRLMPAFPHAIVNYSSGILNVKLTHFILAATIGLAVKSYLFSKLIYQATSEPSLDYLLDFSTYGPLLLLSGIMIIGIIIKHKTHKDDIEP